MGKFRWTGPVRRFRYGRGIMRGVNDLHPAGWGTTSAGVYISNPYTSGGAFSTVLSQSRRQAIVSAGFNTIRYCIDPGTLNAVSDGARTTNIATLIGHFQALVGDGLDVMVNLHNIDGHDVTGWNRADIFVGVGETKFERHVSSALELATAIADPANGLPPSRVAFEPVNEPGFIDLGGWNVMQKSIYDRLRVVMPRHTLVLTGANYASMDAFQSLDPDDYGNDPNVIYTFHGYDPVVFTLGQEENQSWPNTQGETVYDEDYLETRIGQIETWAATNSVPPAQIIDGEWGVRGNFGSFTGATLADRATYSAARRALLEAAGFGWCGHELFGTNDGYGLAVISPSFGFVPEMLGVLIP